MNFKYSGRILDGKGMKIVDVESIASAICDNIGDVDEMQYSDFNEGIWEQLYRITDAIEEEVFRELLDRAERKNKAPLELNKEKQILTRKDSEKVFEIMDKVIKETDTSYHTYNKDYDYHYSCKFETFGGEDEMDEMIEKIEKIDNRIIYCGYEWNDKTGDYEFEYQIDLKGE